MGTGHERKVSSTFLQLYDESSEHKCTYLDFCTHGVITHIFRFHRIDGSRTHEYYNKKACEQGI